MKSADSYFEEWHDVALLLKRGILQPQSEPDTVEPFAGGPFFYRGRHGLKRRKISDDESPPPKKSGKKDGIKSEMWNDVQLQYGKLLLEKRHPVLKRYLEREIRIRTDILKSIEKKDFRRYK